jgi:hypothetical protein
VQKELQVITCCQATTENMRGSNQISDISRFWVNDVTLIKLRKIANRKFHDLFQICRGIHGKNIVLPAIGRSGPSAIAKPGHFTLCRLPAVKTVSET